MEELGTCSASWTEVLAAAAIRQCEVVQLTEVIDEHGYTYETVNTGGSVMVRARPEVAQRSEAHRHLQSLLAELGLTPAARSKVTAKSKGSSNAFLKLA
jgi:P27 family predicted phage terminase small subunit